MFSKIKVFLKKLLPPPVHTFMREINRLSAEINRVSEKVNELNNKILWNNKFEKGVVSENWGKVTEQADFSEKYLKLVSGLDSESARTVNKILERQRKYLSTDNMPLDLFTLDEQKQLRELYENFTCEILKVSEDIYAYRNYLLPTKELDASVLYYKHGIDQISSLESLKGKCIVDVGGFVGDSVLVLSELNPQSIYTFEAEPKNFELLKKTISMNNVPNVVAENLALSNKTGEMVLHVAGSGTTGIDRPGINYTMDIKVPMTTLDDYVAEHGLSVGLIKVDIEGGEPLFLEGAKNTICQQKPILLISIYHNAHDFFELKPLVESWNLGYTFKIFKPLYNNLTSETLLIAEINN